LKRKLCSLQAFSDKYNIFEYPKSYASGAPFAVPL
jgi:hypothetical protein